MLSPLTHRDFLNLRAAFAQLAAPFDFFSIEEWQRAARTAVLDVINADSSAFLFTSPLGQTISCDSHIESAASDWQQYYHTIDTAMTAVLARRGVQVFHVSKLYDMAAFRRSELYSDWVLPNRLLDAVAMVVERPHLGSTGSMHCYFSRWSNDRRRNARERLSLLVPAFKAGMELMSYTDLAAVRLAQMIDAVPGGVCVFDADGAIQHQSPTLVAMPRNDPEFHAVQLAIGECASAMRGLIAKPRKSTDSEVMCPTNRRVRTDFAIYSVCATQVRKSLADELIDVVVFVTIENSLVPSAQRLAERFALTPRETQVVQCLALGLTNAQIAARLGISPHTVFRHSEHIFRKCNVQSRGALMALVTVG